MRSKAEGRNLLIWNEGCSRTRLFINFSSASLSPLAISSVAFQYPTYHVDFTPRHVLVLYGHDEPLTNGIVSIRVIVRQQCFSGNSLQIAIVNTVEILMGLPTYFTPIGNQVFL